MKMFKSLTAVSFGLALVAAPLQADVIVGGMGGPAGYGEDETYTEWAPTFNLPFQVKIGGDFYNTFTAFQDGDIHISSGGFDSLDGMGGLGGILTPFYAPGMYDCFSCGQTYIGSPSEGVVAVTWDRMSRDGFNNGDDPTNKENTFQALIIDRSAETGSTGDFDVEFRYSQIEYFDVAQQNSDFLSSPGSIASIETSDEQFYALPGSGTEAVMDLPTTSNVGEDGIWAFSFRDGQLIVPEVDDSSTGSGTELDPYMPTDVVDGGWEFEFEVVDTDPVFIDPDVAIGYDYVVSNGPNFASVILPSGFDADYELWLMGANGWVFTDTLSADVEYFFAQGGVSMFRILGIDTSNMIDPTDAQAFVTGLTFVELGNVSMSQTPITEFVADTTVNVSEPAPLILFSIGLGFLALRRRKV